MTPEEAARTIVLDRLQKDVELFLALQFLGWIDADQLVSAFPDQLVEPDPVAAIIAAVPTPDPRAQMTFDHPPVEPDARYTRGPSTLMSPGEVTRRFTNAPSLDGDSTPVGPTPARPDTYWRPLLWRGDARPSPKQTTQAQAAFAAWVEGDHDYSPGIAGEVD